MLASGSNCAVKPTRLRRAAYFRSLYLTLELHLDLELKNRTVLITGGTSGIGLAIADKFATEGCNVITFSRSDSNAVSARKLLERHGVNLTVERYDVTSEEVIEWAASLSPIDIFVPNVSALSSDWPGSIETDLMATVRLTEAVIPKLMESPVAAITYIGSKAASFATPGFEAYGAAKAAMTHYMKSLSQRLSGRVRVNTVSPGDTFVPGGFWERVRDSAPEAFAKAESSSPMQRFCTPEEVANTVVFISSPAASFVNGANLLVDGGATVHVHG